jgi:hypothetical protein
VLFQGGQSFGDNALMPGWGVSASGTTTAPIMFGSYGAGQATITQGVWFKSDDNLAFANLTLGASTGSAGAGFQGHGNGITLEHLTITHANLGVNAEGNDWTIADSTITHNHIAYGGIGLGWFQYDTTPGASTWADNTIDHVTAAGIFVAGTKQCSRQALESFQISHNTITHATGDLMNLQPTTGTYNVFQNSLSA